MTEITPEQEAVIAKARELVIELELKKEGSIFCILDIKMKELAEAISALDAPKPVKPEDVPVGTRFRFAHMIKGMENREFILVHNTANGQLGFIEETGPYLSPWTVYPFDGKTDIIPIQDES